MSAAVSQAASSIVIQFWVIVGEQNLFNYLLLSFNHPRKSKRIGTSRVSVFNSINIRGNGLGVPNTAAIVAGRGKPNNRWWIIWSQERDACSLWVPWS